MRDSSRHASRARPLHVVDAESPAAVLAALREALAGGPAVLPRRGGERRADDPDTLSGWPDDACLVIETSGSTARPKRVVLTASALRASAAGSARRLAELTAARAFEPGEEPGQWLLCLPVDYIAGAQVLLRSILAGTEPGRLAPGSFTAARFLAAAERLSTRRRFVSLVPAQLQRLLEAAEATTPIGDPGPGPDPEQVAATVAGFEAVLVGGQATPPELRQRAAVLGWRIVTTYGASETAGGCVYDAVPFDGVQARLVDGELQLRGPVLAAGYLDEPQRTEHSFVPDAAGERWYRTGDAGEVLPAVVGVPPRTGQRLRVTGRLDDVLISGGEKVLLGWVEQLVRALPGYEQAFVVAVPDEQWGQVPAIVLADASLPDTAGIAEHARLLAADPAWQRLRERVAQAVGRAARPAHRIRVRQVPMLPSGKLDRRALAALAAELLAETV